MKIYDNHSISPFSFIHIGGIVKRIIFAFNEKELISSYKNKTLVVGNTSKILFAFDNYQNTIIFDRNSYILEKRNSFVVGSGTSLSYLGKYFEQSGYKGFSFIRTIPGLIGGSIVQNASFLNQSISDNLISVTFIENGKVVTKKKKELNFSYRFSYFKFHKACILHCEFKKVKDNTNTLKKEFQMALEKRKIQPKNEISLGSIFQNKLNFKVGKVLNSCLESEYALTKNVSLSKYHYNFLNIKKECTYKEILLLINSLFIVLYKKVGIIFPLEIIIIKGGD